MPHNRKKNAGSTTMLWLCSGIWWVCVKLLFCKPFFCMVCSLWLSGTYQTQIVCCDITFRRQVCILAKWQIHLFFFFLIYIISQMKDNVCHWLYIQCMFPISFFAVLSKALESVSQFLLQFFSVLLSTKATAILGALLTLIYPLLRELGINLYRTQSYLEGLQGIQLWVNINAD